MKRRLLLCSLALPLAATPVSAQSFLENFAKRATEQAVASAAARLESAARRAASTAAEKAMSAPAAERAADSGAEETVLTPKPRAGRAERAPAGTESPASAPASLPSTGPAPWPLNAGKVTYPSDLEFSSELKAQADAFKEFGRVKCTGCEGGYTFDSWAQQAFNLRGYNAWEKKVGALALGEKLEWNGAESKGRLTVVSETPVGGLPCKQLKWELTKASSRAERPGLFCFGKQNQFAGSDSWVEVF
jgi:hypothetical protein